MDLDQELEIALACLDQYSLDQERVRNMAKEYDENNALGLVVKKTSRYKRVNDTSVFRNNARNFQFDYEEDYYEPHSKK